MITSSNPLGFNKPCWHLCTDGTAMPNFFSSESDFKIGINGLAYCACIVPGVIILTFVLMSNHIHLILMGDREDCLKLFHCFKAKLTRCLPDKTIDWKPFKPNLILIGSNDYLRTSIAYVNRNPYVLYNEYTPFNYPWGAGREFFSYKDRGRYTQFLDMQLIIKRQLLHSKDFDERFNRLRFDVDLVDVTSFCRVDLAEKVYANAGDYISLLMKNVEKFKEFASLIDDKIFITDKEMDKIALLTAQEKYNVQTLIKLTTYQRNEHARFLKREYNATKSQLRRILRLPQNFLDELFPQKQ